MGLCPLRRDRVVALASGVKAFVACGGAGGWSGPGSGSAPALTPAIAPQSRCCARWLSLAAGLSFAAQYPDFLSHRPPRQVKHQLDSIDTL